MDFQATLSLLVLKKILTYDEAQALWDGLFGRMPPPTLFQCLAQFEEILDKVKQCETS